jgi:hypothetical protein
LAKSSTFGTIERVGIVNPTEKPVNANSTSATDAVSIDGFSGGESAKVVPFVADGYERVEEAERESLREAIKSRVIESYRPQMTCAGVVRRFWLRLRIHIEINRQLTREWKHRPSKSALY